MSSGREELNRNIASLAAVVEKKLNKHKPKGKGRGEEQTRERAGQS